MKDEFEFDSLWKCVRDKLLINGNKSFTFDNRLEAIKKVLPCQKYVI